MAQSYIGKPIAIISHSDVRYRGILAGIDQANSTIQLSNVYSMGTENRRPPAEYMPPVPEAYQYIIFRASEVKDLAFDQEPPQPPPVRAVPNDPAIVGAAPMRQPTAPYGYPNAPPQPGVVPPQAGGAFPARAAPAGAPAPPAQPQQAQGQARRASAAATPVSTAVSSATASMESVERALDDLRVSSAQDTAPPHAAGGGGGGGGRGGRGGRREKAEVRVPTSDFDFAGNNARFDKERAKPQQAQSPAGEEGEADEEEEEEEEEKAYDPKKSFFDTLAPARGGPGGGERGRGRGRGGRSRRDEERDKNVATFGEPGGVGLLGPGAYVGGWGGYGRRGGGRGRRGQPREGGAPPVRAGQ